MVCFVLKLWAIIVEFSSGTNEQGNVNYSVFCVARVGHQCIINLDVNNNKLKGQQFYYSLHLSIKNH